MSPDDGFWNRDELYEEVWSTPMWTLAKKYGISDVALAKTCRKLNVPLPGRGYWAKKQAGQKLKRPPLPAAKGTTLFLKPTAPTVKPQLGEPGTEEELAQLARIESRGTVELKRGSLSHPLIFQARAVLSKARADDRGILGIRDQCLDIRVSKASLDRAIRIMARLIEIMEEEGFEFVISKVNLQHENGARERTIVKILGQEVKFGIIERAERIETPEVLPGSLVHRVISHGSHNVTYEPSGKLSIEVFNAWEGPQQRWKDSKSTTLEDLLPQIAAGFVRIGIAKRIEAEKRASAEREHRRRIIERQQLEAAIAAEQARLQALLTMSAEWSQADRLWAFVAGAREAGIQNGQNVEAGTPFGDWLIWAEQQADRLDPLKDSPPSVIDRKPQLEPEAPSWSTPKKPESSFRFPKPIWRMK